MGRDKATLPFGGEVLLQRVVRLVAEWADDVVVVARPGQALPSLDPDVRVVRDEVLDQGPLGGLAPGLRETRAQVAFVTGCDTPFLSRHVVDLLFERLGGNDVAVAETEGFVHPLCAVYSAAVGAEVKRLLAEGRLRPIHLYERVATTRVGEDELRRVDPELRSFRNCNTPEAYAQALAEAGL